MVTPPILPTPQQVSVLKRWQISTFFVCLLGYIGYYLCRKNLPAAFPLLSEEFGYTNSQLGLIAAYSEIAYAVGKLINGPLADKLGGKKIFLTGMLGAIFFNLVFSQLGNLTAFIIVWCLCRYFLSMGWGALAKMIGAWYEPSKNGTVMGWISINFQFGGVIATLLAGSLVAAGFSWQMVFIVPSGVLFLVFIWSYFASKNSPQEVIPNVVFGGNQTSNKTPVMTIETSEEEHVARPTKVIKALLRLSIFRHLLVYSFLTTLLRSIFFFWTPKFLTDIGMGTSTAILKSAIFPLLGATGTILLGWYTDRYAKNGDRGDMMWKMLSGLIFSTLLIAWLVPNATESHSLIVVLLGASGFFLLGPYSMSSGCLTLDIAGSKGAGSCTGMIDGVGYIGGALASFGAGYLSDHLGWQGVFYVITLVAGLSTLSAFMISKDFQRKASSP